MEQHPAEEAQQMYMNPDGTTRPETEDERIARIKQRTKLRAQMDKITKTAAAAREKDQMEARNYYTDYRPADRALYTDADSEHHTIRVIGRDNERILCTKLNDDDTPFGNTFWALPKDLIMIERGAGHPTVYVEPAARHQTSELDAEELLAGILIGREAPMPDATVHIQRLHSDARIPAQAKHGDAGYDLHSIEDTTVPRGSRKLIGTGIAVAIPHGYVGLIMPRSGLANKHGIDILGGVIDSGYRGEVKVILQNHDSAAGFAVNVGDRIAQLVIQPVASVAFAEIDTLPDSERAADGFGSTGQ